MTKKEQIEQTARELFWKYGFKKVSIEEICKKAGVSRKTYYTYFPNKPALVIALLEKMTNEMLEIYDRLIDDETKTFSEKMTEMLSIKFQMNKDFSMEFVSDFFHPDSVEILEYFNGLIAKSMQMTRNFFEEAQKKGEMNSNLSIDFVMWNMQKQMELFMSSESVAMFKDTESMTRQMSELMIYGVMPVK